MDKKPTRIKQVNAVAVAKACGVSQPTVSRIMGGKAHLCSKATQKLVLETARKMGYRPNSAARAIVTGRFDAVGLIFRDDSHLGTNLIHGVNAALRENQLRLLLSPTRGNDPGDLDSQVLAEMTVDGLLVCMMQEVTDTFRNQVESLSLPVVWINNKKEWNSVYADDAGIVEQMTKELHARGHRRIAWLGSDITKIHHYTAADRWSGYQNAMGDLGLPPVFVMAAQPGDRLRQRACQQILEARPRPTAVISSSESLGYELLYTAALRGIRVPSELSVLVIQNSPTSYFGLQVGGGMVPFHAMGERGAHMLVSRVKQPKDKKSVALPFTFIPGDTLGPVPKRNKRNA